MIVLAYMVFSTHCIPVSEPLHIRTIFNLVTFYYRVDLTLKKQSEDELSLHHMWSHSQWMRHIFEARNWNLH